MKALFFLPALMTQSTTIDSEALAAAVFESVQKYVADEVAGAVVPLIEQLKALPAGPQSEPGADGAAGQDGVPGRDGVDGKDGSPASPGSPGMPGTDGAPGRDGIDGRMAVTARMVRRAPPAWTACPARLAWTAATEGMAATASPDATPPRSKSCNPSINARATGAAPTPRTRWALARGRHHRRDGRLGVHHPRR